MHARIFILGVVLLGLLWCSVAVGGRAGAQGVSVATIEQQLTNQRLLINQLQARLATLEERTPAGPVKPAIRPAAPRFVRPKTSVADMTPGLVTLQRQHARFATSSAAAPPSGPDLAAQVASLTKEVAALKSELSGDEALIYGELQLVRNNVNTVDNDTTITYGDAVQAAWLACVDYGHQVGFAGWTPLYGNPPAPCFAVSY